MPVKPPTNGSVSRGDSSAGLVGSHGSYANPSRVVLPSTFPHVHAWISRRTDFRREEKSPQPLPRSRLVLSHPIGQVECLRRGAVRRREMALGSLLGILVCPWSPDSGPFGTAPRTGICLLGIPRRSRSQAVRRQTVPPARTANRHHPSPSPARSAFSTREAGSEVDEVPKKVCRCAVRVAVALVHVVVTSFAPSLPVEISWHRREDRWYQQSDCAAMI